MEPPLARWRQPWSRGHSLRSRTTQRTQGSMRLFRTMSTLTSTRHSRRPKKTLLEPTSKKTYDAPKLVVPVGPSRDHVQGDPKAVLTLVEYGNYQCPFCGPPYPDFHKTPKNPVSKIRSASP